MGQRSHDWLAEPSAFTLFRRDKQPGAERRAKDSKSPFCKGSFRGCLQAAFKLERLFVRNIAMCFDNTPASVSEQKHSKTICREFFAGK
jgi:hypothetical protein